MNHDFSMVCMGKCIPAVGNNEWSLSCSCTSSVSGSCFTAHYSAKRLTERNQALCCVTRVKQSRTDLTVPLKRRMTKGHSWKKAKNTIYYLPKHHVKMATSVMSSLMRKAPSYLLQSLPLGDQLTSRITTSEVDSC